MKRPMFDEKGDFIDDGIPICLGGKVQGGTPNFGFKTRQDSLSLCRDKESPISTMLKDRVMYRHIKHGNASDRELKKDAEIIQRNASKKRKAEEKERIWKPANESLARYRKRYKQDPL